MYYHVASENLSLMINAVFMLFSLEVMSNRKKATKLTMDKYCLRSKTNIIVCRDMLLSDNSSKSRYSGKFFNRINEAALGSRI